MNESLLILIFGNGIIDHKHMSGGDKIFMRLAKQWSELGHEVHIYTSAVGARVCSESGLKNCHVIGRTHETGNIWVDYLLRMLSLARLRPPAQPDIIYSSSDYIFDTIPCWNLRMKWPNTRWLFVFFHRIPSPFTRKGSNIFSNLGSYMSQQFSLRCFSRLADWVITENSFNKKFLIHKGLDPKRIHVLLAPPDFSKITRFGKERTVYDACYIGRIHSSKGVFDLLKAWEKVILRRPSSRLAIVGGGRPEMVQEFASKINNSPAKDAIEYLGFVAEKTKFEVLQQSKILLLASYEEGVPLVFSEAWFLRIPVIAYYLPTYADVSSALIPVKRGDVDGLASTILSVLEGRLDTLPYVESATRFLMNLDWGREARTLLKANR